MRHDFYHAGRSAQIRGVPPEDGPEMHPRLAAMVDALREIAARGSGATFDELRQLDFTPAEIVEYGEAAAKLAGQRWTRQVAPVGDGVAAFIEKAIAAEAHRPPLCSGMALDDTMRAAWAQFCAARAAFKLDPWVSQAERCIGLMKGYLNTQPLLPREVNRVLTGLGASQQRERRYHG